MSDRGWVLDQTTAPTEEPLTLAEVKAHLRVVDTSAEDDLLNRLIQAAREYAEDFTNRQFVTATWKLYLDSFREAGRIVLPRPPLIAVSSIAYLDSADASQTWDSANYVVVADSQRRLGWIQLAPLATYPTTYGDRYNAVTITYTAGYGAATAVPAAIKTAMLAHIGTNFGYREDIMTGTIKAAVPEVSERLLGPYVLPYVDKPWQRL